MSEKSNRNPVSNGVAKVPVVMQMEALECGAACLCMVLAYYGKWIPLEVVRGDCGVSRDGSNAKNIISAARSYGLETHGYKLEPEELKKFGSFPCIIHWEFNHFVVCDGFRGDRVYINDPARGSYSVSKERFDESFTGVCILLEPTKEFEPGGKPRSVLGFALKRIKGARSAIIFVLLTTIITSLTGIFNSAYSRVFLDYLLPGKYPGWVPYVFTGMAILVILQVATAWINAVYTLRLNGKMAAVGSATFMWKILKLPMNFFSQRMTGDIEQRMESNASIASQVVNTFTPLILDTAMLIFYLVVMIRYSWILTLVGIGSMILNAVVSGYISRKRVNITRVAMRDAGKLSGATVSAMDMIETIKASGAENGYFEKWSGYQASVNTQQVRFARLNHYLGIIPGAINTITDTLILCLGVWLTMQGRFTVGSIMAFQGFMQSFMAPATNLIGAGQSLTEMRSDMERIEDVMEYPDDPILRTKTEEGQAYEKLSGSVTIKDLTFGYSKLGQPLLENFSMSMKTGQTVAFVGASGCGKSTLAKLISGLYQPWSGEILYDGRPISDIDRSVFTGSVAVVDQNIILFEDTIANNIKMWDSSIEDFEMIMAARDAQLHGDIMQREGGYQYKILEGGKDFSGGQKQRLEIARVLASDPTLIIMDEATSALDARTEYDVVRSIHDRGISCIVIAHRLSTIRDCDEIIVLDHGKVVERGTHDELIKLNGKYTELVTSE